MFKKIALGLSLMVSFNAYATNSIDRLFFSSQASFSDLAKDLTSALDHNSLVPAESLGITGFDLGVSITNTKFDNSSLLNVDLSHVNNSLQMLSVQAHKGLPYGIDVGLAYSIGLGGNIRTFSYEISYAILSGNVALPAITAKYTGTNLSGVSALEYDSSAIEVGISKGFANITPYAGIGMVFSSVDPKTTNLGTGGALSKVSHDLTKTYFGVNINVVSYDILIDVTNIGESTSLSLKTGFRF